MSLANPKTVLGDFSNRTFLSHGVETRFYQEGGTYFIETEGVAGARRSLKFSILLVFRHFSSISLKFNQENFKHSPLLGIVA